MTATSPSEVTQLLHSWQDGDERALDDLLPLVYNEMRTLAASYLRKERAGHTLQPTALAHEAYVRLLGKRPAAVKDRAHFFALAAQAMRRILVDHARRYRAGKRIGVQEKVPLEDAPELATAPRADLLEVHQALERLAEVNERQAKLVELRYFGGLTSTEVAEVLGASRATVARDWQVARVFLRRQLAQA